MSNSEQQMMPDSKQCSQNSPHEKLLSTPRIAANDNIVCVYIFFLLFGFVVLSGFNFKFVQQNPQRRSVMPTPHSLTTANQGQLTDHGQVHRQNCETKIWVGKNLNTKKKSVSNSTTLHANISRPQIMQVGCNCLATDGFVSGGGGIKCSEGCCVPFTTPFL